MPGLVGPALEPSLSVNCELWYGGRPHGEREEFGHRSQRVSMLWGSMETSHPYFQSRASRSLNPSEDNITRNRMMNATEDEVCEWFPGGIGVTEKPASW